MISYVWQCLSITDSVNLRTSCLSYRAVMKSENIGLLTVNRGRRARTEQLKKLSSIFSLNSSEKIDILGPVVQNPD